MEGVQVNSNPVLSRGIRSISFFSFLHHEFISYHGIFSHFLNFILDNHLHTSILEISVHPVHVSRFHRRGRPCSIDSKAFPRDVSTLSTAPVDLAVQVSMFKITSDDGRERI